MHRARPRGLSGHQTMRLNDHVRYEFRVRGEKCPAVAVATGRNLRPPRIAYV